MTDSARSNTDAIQRLCTGCRQLLERGSLYRLVHDRCSKQVYLYPPGVEKAADVQGRSSYVCNKVNCLQLVLKGKKLQKSLKTPLPDGIVAILEGLLKASS